VQAYCAEVGVQAQPVATASTDHKSAVPPKRPVAPTLNQVSTTFAAQRPSQPATGMSTRDNQKEHDLLIGFLKQLKDAYGFHLLPGSKDSQLQKKIVALEVKVSTEAERQRLFEEVVDIVMKRQNPGWDSFFKNTTERNPGTVIGTHQSLTAPKIADDFITLIHQQKYAPLKEKYFDGEARELKADQLNDRLRR
jgi:hypothetical protein